MKQAADIRDAVQPDEILFVVDAMIGQDAVTTAQAFLDGVGFTGVVLTKLDGDARGGAALSVAQVTGRPGHVRVQRREARPTSTSSTPTGWPRASSAWATCSRSSSRPRRRSTPTRPRRWPASSARGEDFTLEDFLAQMQAVRKMGSMSKMLGHAARAWAQMREQLENFDEREIDRIDGDHPVDDAGTSARNPKILNGSRRPRIAKGSGRRSATSTSSSTGSSRRRR